MNNLQEYPTILIVADEESAQTYGIVMAEEGLFFRVFTAKSQWHTRWAVGGRHGPLSPEFLEQLVRADPGEYSTIVVDQPLVGVIPALRKGCYTGPIIGLPTFDDSEEAIIDYSVLLEA